MIGAFYIVALLAIGIGGDFPLNDDWAYAEGVRHLLLGEGLIMPNVCAAGIAHVALGFLFAKVLGYSYVSLRICSFLITIVGAVAFFIAAASLRIPRAQATFLTLLYAANPILLNIAFGFMSDSTALALNMVFLACLTRGLSKNSIKTVALAFAVLAVAVTVRQSALIFLVSSPLCLSKRFGAGRKRFVYFAASIILPLASAAACDHWLMTSHLESGSVNIGYDLVKKAHSVVIQKCLFAAPEMALPALCAVVQVLCYLALFCMPALLAVVTKIARQRRNDLMPLNITVGVCIVVFVSALVTICVNHQTMPFSENILRFTTIGAQGILGIIRHPLDPRGRLILSILAFISMIPLVLVLAGCVPLLRKKMCVWPSAVVTSCTLTCLAFLTLETIVRGADRYYLIALGPTLLAIGISAKRARIALVNPFSILLLMALSFYSIAGNQEYLSSNRARWHAIEWLEKTGVNAAIVDGGYEYNILRDISIYNTKYRGEPPRDNWRWWPIKGETYIISLSPVPGYKTIHLEPYFSLVDRKKRNIEVLEWLPEETHLPF